MWRVIDLIADACWREETYLMCRCAVDRSQGQLVDLSIDNFEDDDLLSYVAHRSSHLRRLTVVNPCELSPSVLAEAVKKLPQLETLHLINISPLDAECVEAIGISCPLLKSFIYDEVFGDVEEGNRIALAIAKTMPNLHHLQPAKYWEDYEGLKAIRDGCPYLESFDLLGRYEAHDLYISGDLRESKVGPGPMRKVRQPGPKKKILEVYSIYDSCRNIAINAGNAAEFDVNMHGEEASDVEVHEEEASDLEMQDDVAAG